ncbi:MAG: sugar transferase [Nitrospirota bacterium]
MLRKQSKVVDVLQYLCDVIALITMFLCAYWVRDTLLSSFHTGHLVPLRRYLELMVPIVGMWSLVLYYYGLYEAHRAETLRLELKKLLKVAGVGTLISGTLAFTLKLDFTSRLFIVLFGGMALIGLSASRIMVRGITDHIRRQGLSYRNILVIGTGKRVNELIKIVEDHKEWGLRLVGLITDRTHKHSRKLDQYSILDNAAAVRNILENHVVDEVIIAVPQKRLDDFQETFLTCEELGVPVRVAMNLFPCTIAKMGVDYLGGISFLTFSTTPQDELVLACKRVFDIVAALVGLVLLCPLWVLIALMIKLTSSGPVLFGQTRVSLNGRQFRMYKFRSMVEDAEVRQKELLNFNEMDGPVFKLKNDPRVTSIGRLLRKTSLDEFPQLINVLKGEMSIVGPRPPLPAEVDQYQPWQRRRLSMRPGLTCLWQISGRNTIRDFNQWMRLDLQYIDNWSLELDLRIFAKTFLVVLRGRGAG